MQDSTPVACPSGDLGQAALRAATADAGASDATSGRAFGALVWCQLADKDEAAPLVEKLGQLRSARQYCGAYPWEMPSGTFDEVQQRARATIWHIAPFHTTRHEVLRQAHGLPGLDAAVVQLLAEIASIAPDQWPPLIARVRDRLGAAPQESCAGMAMRPGLVIRQIQISGDGHGAGVVRIGVSTQDPGSLSGLGRYLCRAGCLVSFTTVDPEDSRLESCLEVVPQGCD